MSSGFGTAPVYAMVATDFVLTFEGQRDVLGLDDILIRLLKISSVRAFTQHHSMLQLLFTHYRR